MPIPYNSANEFARLFDVLENPTDYHIIVLTLDNWINIPVEVAKQAIRRGLNQIAGLIITSFAKMHFQGLRASANVNHPTTRRNQSGYRLVSLIPGWLRGDILFPSVIICVPRRCP